MKLIAKYIDLTVKPTEPTVSQPRAQAEPEAGAKGRANGRAQMGPGAAMLPVSAKKNDHPTV